MNILLTESYTHQHFIVSNGEFTRKRYSVSKRVKKTPAFWRWLTWTPLIGHCINKLNSIECDCYNAQCCKHASVSGSTPASELQICEQNAGEQKLGACAPSLSMGMMPLLVLLSYWLDWETASDDSVRQLSKSIEFWIDFGHCAKPFDQFTKKN